MLRFKPYPGMTIACAILFVILCGLGSWQVQRLHWKLDLIARVDRQIRLPPIPLDDGRTLPVQPETSYTHATLHGHFDNAKETYLFGTGSGGAPVYHVIVPFTDRLGHVVLVDRGVVPKEKLDPATRRAGQIAGETQITGIWRWPDAPSTFTPTPDLAHGIWYAHDLAAIAARDQVTLFQPGILEADATPNPGGWPKGGQTVVEFRNQHLSYAITWFGLALCLLGVWLAYHIQKARIACK
jgi:surfeit locus 1 family protein